MSLVAAPDVAFGPHPFRPGPADPQICGACEYLEDADHHSQPALSGNGASAPSESTGATVSKVARPAPETRNMADLLARPPVAPPRLLEPSLIVEGGLTVVAAPTKVGKTNFWLHVAWALSEGEALFGRFDAPRPVPVLMLQLELSEATTFERLAALRQQLGWSEDAQRRFFVRCERAMLLDRRGGADRVTRIIEDCPEMPQVVILDSYNAAVAGDPDKSAEARRALHALREIQERTGVTWAVTAEVRKAPAGGRLSFSLDDLKGSNELAYDADAVLVLRPTDQTRRRLAMHFLAMRHLQGEAPEGLVLVRKGLSFELTEGGGDELEEAVAEILKDHFKAGGEKTWRACAEVVRGARVKASNNTITTVRKRLIGASA